MITKSISVFVVLSVSFVVLAASFPSVQVGLQGGSQWDKNKMNAETVIYGSDRYDVVVVGSSIAARLVELPENWFNLAMPGNSCITGVEVLAHSNLQPCTIVVETNNIKLGNNKDFQDDFLVSQLKARLPAFRAENKPSHLGLRLIAKVLGMRAGDARRVTTEIGDAPDQRTVPDELFNTMLSRQLKVCEETLDASDLANRMARLTAAIEKLESRGFHFVLVEVPECSETYATPLRTQIREAIKKAFPDTKYTWFDDQKNHQLYATNDAIHLIPASASRFARKMIVAVSGNAP